MPYNKELHSNLGYIDAATKEHLDTICVLTKRSIKSTLEMLIEDKYTEMNIKEKVVD